MKRLLVPFACAIGAACLAHPAAAADSVRFKPLGSTYQDVNNAPLKNPEGVACLKSAVVVADTGNGRLVRFTLANDELKDGAAVTLEQVGYPIRLKATAKGELLALDGRTRKIARLSGEGTFIGYLEPQNVPAPATIVPRSMAVDRKNNVYLLDILGARVLMLDPDGKFLRQIPFPKEYGFISDLAVDQRGNILALDSLKSRVFRALPEAAAFEVLAADLQNYLYFAVAMETDSQGRIFLLDQNDNAVVLLGQDGSFQGRYLTMGWKNGQLYFPAQGCVTDSGNFVVADRNNSRLQMFKIQ